MTCWPENLVVSLTFFTIQCKFITHFFKFTKEKKVNKPDNKNVSLVEISKCKKCFFVVVVVVVAVITQKECTIWFIWLKSTAAAKETVQIDCVRQRLFAPHFFGMCVCVCVCWGNTNKEAVGKGKLMAPNVKMCFCSFFVAENRKKLREGTFGLALKINSICDTLGKLRRGAKKEKSGSSCWSTFQLFQLSYFVFYLFCAPFLFNASSKKWQFGGVAHSWHLFFIVVLCLVGHQMAWFYNVIV